MLHVFFFYVSVCLQLFLYSYFYVSPSLYMDVFFNLPISKIIHMYLQIKDWFLYVYVDNSWDW